MVQAPHREPALQLFTFAKHRRVTLYTTPDSFMTADYVARKYLSDHKKRAAVLTALLRYTQVVSITRQHLETALASRSSDFEDAAKLEAAQTIDGLHCIVTRDRKGFANPDIRVVTSEQLVKEISKA